MIDLNALKAKHEELNNKNSGGDFVNNFLQIKEGENTIRILPGPEGSDFYAETAIHRIPTGNGKEVKNCHCRKIQGNECPICDLYYSLWDSFNNTGKEEDKALATKIKARSRYYLNVYDRSSEEVKILSVGVILFKKIIATLLDEDYGDITDPVEGHDFKIIKVMEGEWPKYDQSAARPKSTPLHKDTKAREEILAGSHDIHALVKPAEYDEFKLIAESVATTGKYQVASNNAQNNEQKEAKEAASEGEGTTENYLKTLETGE